MKKAVFYGKKRGNEAYIDLMKHQRRKIDHGRKEKYVDRKMSDRVKMGLQIIEDIRQKKEKNHEQEH